jgi:hypothetical protein
MQYKQTLAVLLILCFPFLSFSQTTTYLPQGASENILLERLEIKAGTDSILNFSKTKPFSRRQVIPVIEKYYLKSGGTVDMIPVDLSPSQVKELTAAKHLSNVDSYNARLALEENNEFSSLKFQSKKPIWKSFYKTPANALEVNAKDFFLVVNPVFQYVVGKEKNNSEHIFLNTRGVTFRGTIANKISFSAYATDNQERDPKYVQAYVNERQAVPGAGYFKSFKGTGYDYFDARGTVTLNAAKYIDISFGYDKNFIGNGYRSLFLSDFANNALFLRLNTRIWKFNYQNLFMELVNAHERGADRYLNKKYAALHHLDLGITKWLNLGLFEGIVFGRPDHFEFGYLNPVIFYRSAEQQNGSFDNALAGLDLKANVAHRFQFYGQLLLDEFKLSELSKKWWGNKFGFQAGVKYIDAFTISNLDLQLEWNRVRPFTYSHGDSIANYTHDNLPLAHPLGANFNEVLGGLRYQFAPKWMLQAKAMFYKQGKDTGSASFGSNIFLPNTPQYRINDYGFEVGSGALAKVGYASFLVSYQWKPNLFFEINAVLRKQDAYANVPAQNTSVIYAGIRWNMHRREFEF